MKFKNYMTQKMKSLVLFIGLGLSSAVAFGQMNGSYTIDAAAAASATNFQSWTTFATAWNAAAISGPVTVTVKSSINIGYRIRDIERERRKQCNQHADN